eukprot:CAMPEP_0174749518 /NCGR_PEP_ID=MMETSP1094-20130205/95860_1 /TAXON_ID=156173 /ORGANISM="Chrysochromulina brevifilum, Strain UTEX LB 985" /LENGTH=57 /DNA_ID=CAMNT_0015954735 /DNA_START=90 /DNA_END=264 /DNA_ORIENTATION=+
MLAAQATLEDDEVEELQVARLPEHQVGVLVLVVLADEPCVVALVDDLVAEEQIEQSG